MGKKEKIGGSTRSTTQNWDEVVDNQYSYATPTPPVDDTLLAQYTNRVMVQTNCIIMKDFLPARLVRAKDRWFISFYQTDPVDSIRRRHRETFDLNRIENKVQRLEAAKILVREINSKLPFGYPHDPGMYSRIVSMPVSDALNYALEIKSDLRKATLQSYQSSCRKFLAFLSTHKLKEMPVGSIDESITIAYSDYIIRSGKAAVTHNNLIDEMKAMFNLLKDRKVIFHNPWLVIRKRREAPKNRQPIPPCDIHTILDYLHKNDKSAYLSSLLEFYCMIRPTEQRNIQRRQIDLDKSLIRIMPHFSKNHKDQTVTIPDEFKHILLELGIEELSSTDYIIGYASAIGSKVMVGKNTTSARYTMHIKNLFAAGKISLMNGNTLYSWKDTGGDHFADSIGDAVKMQNQFRHHSLAETQVYISRRTGADTVVLKKHNLPLKHDATTG